VESQEIFSGLWKLRDHDLALVGSLVASHGIDVETSTGEAFSWCKKNAEAGDPRAQHALAKLLWIGLGAKRDDGEAFRWCSQSSEQGYLPATVMLSGFYSTGIGVEVDNARAIHLLESAVKTGSPEAMNLLGTSYYHGLGVERDRSKAVRLWRSAAQLGNADAQCSLGDELIKSSDHGEVSEGVQWLRRAADQGNYSAHSALADLYENGNAGLPQDKRLAAKHREAAAELWGA
jgi:TPR repeat protein